MVPGVVSMNEPDAQLVLELKRYQSGANAHTVNKARCYYVHTKNPKKRERLDAMIRAALVNHDWKPLSTYMRGWW